MQYNKRYFFKDIFILVFVLHVFLLAIVLLCDKGKFHQESFVINTNNLQSTIVFMPLKKRVIEQPKVVGFGHKKDGDRKVLSYEEYEKKLTKQKKNHKKALPKKKVAKSKADIKKAPSLAKPKQKAVVNHKKSPTILKQEKKKKIESDKAFAAKILSTKKAAAKALADKAAKDKVLAEKLADIAAKKAAEKEKIEQNLKQSSYAKAMADKQKIEELAKQEEIKKAEQEKLDLTIQAVESVEENEEDISVDELAQSETSEEEDLDLENISFVGSLDLEMIQIKEQIQAEIAKYYKPPVGISKKAVCDLSIIVGAVGKADRVVVKKTSGSIANDICARAALLKVTFPKEVIGKEIIIALGQ